MIHARIDTVEHRKIVGFETGTLADFDARHGGDPLWVFVDSFNAKYRANFQHFLTNPLKYKVDIYGDLHRSDEPPIIELEAIPVPPSGYKLIFGSDGRYLQGGDGDFLLGLDAGYSSPPNGRLWLVDPDGAYLADPGQVWIME